MVTVGVGWGSWKRWPQRLSGQARQVVEHLQAGRLAAALDLLDELIGDLTERREVLAGVANRRFEPSTDDRQA